MSPGTKVDTVHHAKLCPIPERRGAYCGTCKRAEDKANWVKSDQEKNRWNSLDIYQVVEGNKLMRILSEIPRLRKPKLLTCFSFLPS
jgi:hypothetical protein